jgi:PLP dependent protein
LQTGPMNIERLKANLDEVRGRVAAAAGRAGRDPGSVTLVAVTKKTTPEWVRALVELGATDLGENYPQELWRKAEELGPLPSRWHLIGHLQGNKAKRTLPLVRTIHSVDSLKLLRALDGLASEMGDPPAVCLQVNASGEGAKHGWDPEAVLADAEAIAECRRIPIVGLMTMAALSPTAEEARPAFASLRRLAGEMRRRTGLALNELSMGMSNDFEVAIEEGATLVRVGSALFEGVAS